MNTLKSDQRQNLFWMALFIGLCVLLYSLSAVLTPFLFAAILAYMLNPGVDWLTRHRCPRWLATLTMIVLLTLIVVVLLLIIVPVLQSELVLLQKKFPQMLARLNEDVAPRLRAWFGLQINFSSNSLRRIISERWANEDMFSIVLDYLKIGGLAVVSLLANMLLVPVVLFYLLLDWHPFLNKVQNAIPRRLHDKIVEMVTEIDSLLSQFLRGQLLVMIVLAIYYSAALAVAGFDVALPVGIVTGLLVFIPYIGFSLGLLLAVLAALLQFTNWYGLIAIAVIYGFGQLVESAWLTPRLVGERIGLHPIAVIFALLAFGQVFGFFGILLALPASAALLVGLRHLKAKYLASDFYQRG